jgi:release factor glutamine methyltransferase
VNVKDAFLAGREHLTAAGSSESSIEAEVLLRRAAGWDRAALYIRWESALAADVWERYQALLEERARGRPVHYIIGEREFMGLSFLVDERVLIPRPETEVLVEAVVEFLTGRASGIGHRASTHFTADDEARSPKPGARQLVVDIGTGSGCIAVAVAYHVPSAAVLATDISAGALDVAVENARRHGVADRIEFLAGDMLDPLPPALAGTIDVIASNPPYVPPELVASLPREIRDFEPAVAVVGTGDGLAFHRALEESAPRWLRPGGLLAMEVGAGQAPALCAFVDDRAAFSHVSTLRDYAGIERVVTALRNP